MCTALTEDGKKGEQGTSRAWRDGRAGIKVDKGLVPLPGSNGEQWCMGLDGLDKRSAEYYKAGARFAKWRSVVSIPAGPSVIAVRDCAYGLARYAAISQAAGLVPIVEPEVLLDGDHDIDRTLEVAEAVWAETFKYLADNKVRGGVVHLFGHLGPEPRYRAYQMSRSAKASEPRHMHGCRVVCACAVLRACWVACRARWWRLMGRSGGQDWHAGVLCVSRAHPHGKRGGPSRRQRVRRHSHRTSSCSFLRTGAV